MATPSEASGIGGEAEMTATLVDPTAGAAAGPGKRRVAARGVVINSAFFLGLSTLQLLKALIVTRFLTASEFGVWSIVFLAFGLVFALRAIAVINKYIQQDDEDQERAFQKAFTLELGSSAIGFAVLAALAPVLALIYGEDELLVPTLVVALTLPGLALQAPIWVYYRRLEFLRQRLLGAVDPVVSFVVTIALAIAGFEYWSLVIGLVAGAWAGGIVAILFSPYRLRLRFDRGTLREYVSFSGPLLLAVGLGLGIAQLSVFVGDLAIGLAGVGAIGLAATFSAYVERLDSVVTQTLYPVICRVQGQADLMFEVFIKSNRLALMWALPFGIGLSVFSGDLIEFGIGDQWRDAETLLVVFGITSAAVHIGFNWSAFYRAQGITRPEAVVAVITFVAFCLTAIPLVFAFEIEGFAAGIAAMTVVTLAARWYYLLKLFPRLNLGRYVVRAVTPTAVSVAVVLGLRALETGDRTLALALGELALFIGVNVMLTVVIERRLLREALSYLRRPRTPPAVAT